jgi:uncharacterized protein YqcC (DUF446 family)
MKAHTFDQKLQQAQQRISHRLSHAQPAHVNGLRAHLWVQWIKKQTLFTESRSSRHGQGGSAC